MRGYLCDVTGTPAVPKTQPGSSYRQDRQSPPLHSVRSTPPSAAHKAICETARKHCSTGITPVLITFYLPLLKIKGHSMDCLSPHSILMSPRDSIGAQAAR
jgi:hypothetical protein